MFIMKNLLLKLYVALLVLHILVYIWSDIIMFQPVLKLISVSFFY